jgi:manganese-dependent inorganic pyrophosphatase
MDSPLQLPFFVIGHRNPDTDAICSAIGHAALLRVTGEPNAVAARCGEISPRVAWVLERAGVPVPLLVTDVRVTAGMICRRKVVQVSTADTFLTAYRRMVAAGVRSVPVLDAGGEISGILRYLDLLQLLLPSETEGLVVRTVNASLAKIAATLEAEVAGAPVPTGDHEEELHLLVGASSKETVASRLQKASAAGLIGRFVVVCGDRPVVQRLAIEAGARALIVTGGFGIAAELRALASAPGVVLLLVSQDTASTAQLIRCSRMVSSVVSSDLMTLDADEPVSRLRKRLAATSQELFPVTRPGTRQLLGVLAKSDLIDPPRTRLALVDHNEYAQAVTGVEEAEVVEVIDHHRLAGDLVSREPIRYLNEPVGSTSTLVARKFRHRGLDPEPGVAMCLCAGIISDTLNLTSPTTAELDREMLDWLTGIAGVCASEFTREFFAIGSMLATGSAEEIVGSDRKDFGDEGLRISISQIEELGLHSFAGRRDELESQLRDLTASGYDLAFLVVTDIAKHFSLILASGPEPLLRALPFGRRDETLFEAPGVVSRKKQVFPAVSQAIRRSGKSERELE